MSETRQLRDLEYRRLLIDEMRKTMPALIAVVEADSDPRLQELTGHDLRAYLAIKDVVCPDHHTKALSEPQEEVFI